MSEVINFEVFNSITNADFKTSSWGLIKGCEEIEKYYAKGEYAQCCINVRKENENILRYLNDRLVKNANRNALAGEILHNPEFLEKMDDVEFLLAAEDVQKIGSKYAHNKPYPNETEEQYELRMSQNKKTAPIEAKKIIEQFNEVLKLGIRFINEKISGVRGNLEINLKKNFVKKGKKVNLLRADLTDVVDKKAYTYVWKSINMDGIVQEYGEDYILSEDWLEGDTILLEAKIDGLESSMLRAEYGPIKKEEISKARGEQPKDLEKNKTENVGLVPKGKIIVEIDKSFRGSGVQLRARLEEADYEIEDKDISVEWGFIDYNKKFHLITKRKSDVFICDPNKSVGKRIVFSIKRDGFANPLEGRFRVLTKEDFEETTVAEDFESDVENKCAHDQREYGTKKSKDYSLSLSIGEHDGKKAICANIAPKYFDPKSLQFTWVVETKAGKRITKQYKGVHLETKGIKNGEHVICSVTMPGTNRVLSSEIVCEKRKTAQEDRRESLDSQDSKDIYTTNEKEAEPLIIDDNHISETEEHNLETPVEKEKEIQLENTTSISEKEADEGLADVLDREPIAVPMEELKKEPVIFNSQNGLEHYFVCPADSFALNDLEIVERETYLYRLLRKDGYENIYYFDNDGGWLVKAVDDASSQYLFQNEGNGKQVISSPKTTLLNNKGGSKKESPRRDWLDVSTPDQFKLFVRNTFRPILSNENRKSAFVIPLDLYLNKKYFGDIENWQQIKILREKHYDKNENIIVISLFKRDDLFLCVSEGQTSAHEFSSTVENEFRGKTDVDIVDTAYKELMKRNQIHMANCYGVDEIANVLFRHILYGDNATLKRIKYDKVYGIAQKIKEFYEPNEFKQGKSIKDRFTKLNDKPEGIISGINMDLKNEDVAKELLEVSKSVKSYAIKYSIQMDPLSLERVYSDIPKRYDYDPKAEVEEEFSQYIGDEMEEVKEALFGTVDELVVIKEKDGFISPKDMTYQFVGAPGTGKTTIARLLGKLLYAECILPTDNFVEVNATMLVDAHPGAIKDALVREAENARGGVLFIDEFYALNNPIQGGNTANEGVNALMAILDSDDLYNECIVIAGYEEEVKAVIESNKGGSRRIKNKIEFKPYSVKTLIEIFHAKVKKRGLELESGIDQPLERLFESELNLQVNEAGDSVFGNAAFVENVVSKVLAKYYNRGGEETVVKIEDLLNSFPEKKAYLANDGVDEDLLPHEFENLIGKEMESVIEEIQSAVDLYRIQVESDHKKRKNLVMQFVGPPGTGKTTVAKKLGNYLSEQGLIPTNRIHKVVPSQFQTGHIGDFNTAFEAAAKKARGGVLFIDEFYQINTPYSTDGGGSGNTAKDALDTLMNIADDESFKMCIIMAGYKEEMEGVFRFNNGAQSRFSEHIIEFPVFSSETLWDIFKKEMKEYKFTYDKKVESLITQILNDQISRCLAGENKEFGNARFVEKELVSKIMKKCVKRDKNSNHIIAQDVINAFPDLLNKPKKEFKPRKIPTNLFDDDKLERRYEEKEYEANKLYEETKSSVLYVKAGDRTGTAFLIHPRGYALTCYHVVRGCDEIQVRMTVEGRPGGDETRHDCELVNYNEELDMALIKLKGKNFPYLPLVHDRAIEIGEKYILVGYPFGEQTKQGVSKFEGTISTDGVHTDRGENGGYQRYYIDGNAMSGNSGSPVISLKDGNVIGLLRGAITESHNPSYTEEYNFIRPIHYFWSEFTK